MLQHWLMWLNGLSPGLRTKGLLFRFPVRAHAWVAGQVPSRGRVKGNHTLMFLLPFPSLKIKLKKKLPKTMTVSLCYRLDAFSCQA